MQLQKSKKREIWYFAQAKVGAWCFAFAKYQILHAFDFHSCKSLCEYFFQKILFRELFRNNIVSSPPPGSYLYVMPVMIILCLHKWFQWILGERHVPLEINSLMSIWCRSLGNGTQPATYPLEIIQSESQNINDTDRSLILSSRYLCELSNLILQHTEPLQYTWKKRDFMGGSGTRCGIPHPVRCPSILRPLSRRNPSWWLSTSTNIKEIKGLSKMPGSSWNQKSQVYYDGLRFPIKSPPTPPSDIPGRIVGSFFGRMGNPLGLRGVL